MKQLLKACCIVVVIVFLVTLLTAVIDSIGNDFGIKVSLVIASIAALVSILVLLLWVLPMHYVFKQFEQTQLVWYLLIAILPSFVFIYGFKPFGNDSNIELFGQALFCSFAGGLAASFFWYITVYKALNDNT